MHCTHKFSNMHQSITNQMKEWSSFNQILFFFLIIIIVRSFPCRHPNTPKLKNRQNSTIFYTFFSLSRRLCLPPFRNSLRFPSDWALPYWFSMAASYRSTDYSPSTGKPRRFSSQIKCWNFLFLFFSPLCWSGFYCFVTQTKKLSCSFWLIFPLCKKNKAPRL